ncbi:rubredoxin [Cupriavidus taiwanensis]|uniref:rubredoxin n=1 Tax=Cupriavidus taiwanensis TaxID=164546 RepID=UPI0039C18EB9
MSRTDTPAQTVAETTDAATQYRSRLRVVCGFIYNEQDGVPDEGLSPGTRSEGVPEAKLWRHGRPMSVRSHPYRSSRGCRGGDGNGTSDSIVII